MTVDYTDFDEVAHQDKMHFFYDTQSRPAKIEFNGTLYTYLHNLQGDIVGIVDGSGILVLEYKYDAWGKPLSATGTLADTLGKRNPFRYRGYVFDEEAGLYYLETRYYLPEGVRFISADEYIEKYVSSVHSNAYAYCVNNPINKADHRGEFFAELFGSATVDASWIIGGMLTSIAASAQTAITAVTTAVMSVTSIGWAVIAVGAVALTATIVYAKKQSKKDRQEIW